MNFILDKLNLRTYILSRLRQEEIFAYYLNINVVYIDWCISNKSRKLCNPLRNDTNPSLGFYYKNGRLYMRDFAYSFYNGDCFNLVGLLHGKNVNSRKEFINICNIIIENMIYGKVKDTITINANISISKFLETNSIKQIDIFTRPYTSNDLSYWKSYGLLEDDLKKGGVYPVSSYKCGDYIFNCKDRVFAYILGKKGIVPLVKLYFIDRKKKDRLPRFITNNFELFECVHELRKGNILVITKSRKDVLVLRKLINSVPFENIPNIQVISVSSEGVRLPNNICENLFKLFNKIYTLTDYDLSGISFANYHKRHGFIPLILNKYDKDISDYVKNNGYNKGKELVINYIKANI